MADGWVVNASPLIVLAKVGYIELLSSDSTEKRFKKEDIITGVNF